MEEIVESLKRLDAVANREDREFYGVTIFSDGSGSVFRSMGLSEILSRAFGDPNFTSSDEEVLSFNSLSELRDWFKDREG